MDRIAEIRVNAHRWNERTKDATGNPLTFYEQDIIFLLAEVDRLREGLRRLEWCAGTLSEEPSCPACGMWMSSGHKADCWLKKLLEGE